MIYFVSLDYDGNVRKNKINKKSKYYLIVMCITSNVPHNKINAP